MRQIIVAFLIIFSGFKLIGQEIGLLFYNTENLFDTIDQSGTLDEEFTPFGKHEHSSERYALKVEHLARVLDAANQEVCAGIIALCEVENEVVVADLKDAIGCADRYTIVHFDSPDRRGIDNAFLYDSNMFVLLDKGLHVIDLGEDERPTRGITWGQLQHRLTQDEFFVYVNHWPSRYGGKELSAPKRMIASKTLSGLIAVHRAAKPSAKVIVMGDLNDHPQDPSVQALLDCDTGVCLDNLMEHVQMAGKGTHAYRGDWGVLDHILVDHTLVDAQKGWHVERDGAEPVSFEWMMYEHEESGERYPSRFYGSNAFFGGYSDHLPVKAVLKHLD